MIEEYIQNICEKRKCNLCTPKRKSKTAKSCRKTKVAFSNPINISMTSHNQPRNPHIPPRWAIAIALDIYGGSSDWEVLV